MPALCPSCLTKWQDETLETCGFCAERVNACTCMPKPLEDARARGFCKVVYYTPRRRQPVQNKLIYRIKEQNDGRAFTFLAEEIWQSAEAMLRRDAVPPGDVVITYLPRGRRAKLIRGIDQARRLAEALSCVSGLPVQALIKRTRGANREQKQLSHASRLENAKQSFAPTGRVSLRGRTVLLVDDLVTTGAGMSVCTRLLRRMGAKAVYCAAVAADAVHKDQSVF